MSVSELYLSSITFSKRINTCIYVLSPTKRNDSDLCPSFFIKLKPTKEMQLDFKKYNYKKIFPTIQYLETFLIVKFKNIFCHLDLQEEKTSHFNDHYFFKKRREVC